VVASAPANAKPQPGLELNPQQVSALGRHDYFHLELTSKSPPHILFFKRVYDYRDPQRPVGLVSGAVPLERFVGFTKKLSLGEGIQKSIINAKQEAVFAQKAAPKARNASYEQARTYSAPVPLLDWRIVVSIPEEVLFKDVNQLKFNIFAFAAIVAFVAIAAALIYSRVAIKPLRKIIAGTKEFAAGNLDHRIELKYGVETRQLADEFNLMANQLKERERQLMEVGKLASVGLLSAGLAHEVKNPLAAIKTSAQVVHRHSQDENTRNLTQGISEEVDRLNKIVTDLLSFSPPRPSRKTKCNLAEVVDHSLGLIKAEINQKKVQVIKQVQSFYAQVDSDQMIQVLLNLLLNALAAVEPQKGEIRIESSLGQNGERVLTIADNGHGIPEEKLSGIFDPFFSLSKEGTGLGLSIVHTLLTQNEVKISVSSRVDEGTTFTLRFKSAGGGEQEVARG
jgi:signal transduction histidine kinase